MSDRVTVVNSMQDYVGKRVHYLSERDMWLGATVIGMKVVGGVKFSVFILWGSMGVEMLVVQVDWMDDIRNAAVRLVHLCERLGW